MNNIIKIAIILALLPLFLFSQDKNQKNSAKANKLVSLPEPLKESSGVIFYAGRIWTHNDSGGTPEISAIDPDTGNETARIRITNGTNTDWEDITQDSTHIYIADTGNNMGLRKEFQIYKINKCDINPDGNLQFVKAEIIKYSYEKQPDFLIPYFHDYDCEAIANINGKLFIFNKNWASRTCNIYQIDTLQNKAVTDSTIDTQGLITGADYNATDDRLIMCGYKFELRVFKPFIVEITDFAKGNREFKTYQLPLGNHQVEGICFDDNRILITNEETTGIDLEKYPASLFEVSIDE